MNSATTDIRLPDDFPAAEKSELNIGYIPLLDCIPVVAAKELGFFEEAGLSVTLSRESSWASIRDKVQYGLLDAAPMPAGIVLASAMRLGASQPMVTAMGLGLNGNAITVSKTLWEAINPSNIALNSEQAALALKSYLEGFEGTLNVASVHTYSTHHFLLREWLQHFDIDPQGKLKLIVVPPPQMVDAMQRGVIDIFCVGEPWNSLAQAKGVGHKLLSGHQIWENAPDKVLGVTKAWSESNPATHQRLIAALLKACSWLDNETNKLSGFALLLNNDYIPIDDIDSINLLFGQHSFTPPIATFPWLSQARWFSQHIRNVSDHNQAPESLDNIVEQTYLTSLYREVASALDINLPCENTKDEGVHAGNWEIAGTHHPIVMPSDIRFR